MPTLPHIREPVGCLHTEDDCGRTILSRVEVVEESVPVLQGGSGGWVPRDPPTDPARRWKNHTVGGGAGGGPILPGLLPEYVWGNYITGPGLWWGVNRYNQPHD